MSFHQISPSSYGENLLAWPINSGYHSIFTYIVCDYFDLDVSVSLRSIVLLDDPFNNIKKTLGIFEESNIGIQSKLDIFTNWLDGESVCQTTGRRDSPIDLFSFNSHWFLGTCHIGDQEAQFLHISV